MDLIEFQNFDGVCALKCTMYMLFWHIFSINYDYMYICHNPVIFSQSLELKQFRTVHECIASLAMLEMLTKHQTDLIGLTFAMKYQLY